MIEIFPDEVKNVGFAPAQEFEPVPGIESRKVVLNDGREAEITPIRVRNIECSGFEKEKSRPVPAGQLSESPKSRHRKGNNCLKKYINRFYKICLLNLAAAITMLIIYRNTGNELLVPAIYACVANGLLTYMCVE